MLTSLVNQLIGLPNFKGKGMAIRQALRLVDGRAVRSRYGPLMRVRAGDQTNFFCISGRNESEYGDVYKEPTSSLAPGMAFLDIGANVGLFSLVASQMVGEQGVVLAFEPSMSVFNDLVGNAALNGLRNFFPFNLAIRRPRRLPDFSPAVAAIPVWGTCLKVAIYRSSRSTWPCLLYTSPSPRDQRGSRMPSSA